MRELFASGRIVETILALMVLEALALGLHHEPHWTGQLAARPRP